MALPLALVKLAGLVPYAVGAPVVRWVVTRVAARPGLCPGHARRVRAILALAAPSADGHLALRRHLMATACHPWINRWRLLAIGRRALPALGGWVQLTGIERLERARAAGRGVLVLGSHTGGSLGVPRVLARMGLEVLSLEGSQPRAETGAPWLRRLRVVAVNQAAFLPRVALEAQRALERGEIVFLAADGLVARSGLVLPFLGRWRRFAIGFAELSIATGAAVLPVQAPFDDDGRLHIEILDPLDPGSDRMDRRERVESLVRQYARLLEARSRQDPAGVPARHLDLLLEQLDRGRAATDVVSGVAGGP